MFFGGLFLSIFTGAFFSSTGTGKARIALNSQYSHASSAMYEKEELQLPLFSKQASLAVYFRNAANIISAYSKDEQLKHVVSLMDEANLTGEEKDYTISLIKSEESNPGGFKDSYENFDRWIDKVIAPRVESSQLPEFKKEAKIFYESVDKNDFLASDIPKIIFITGLLSAVGLVAYQIIKP